MNIVSDKNRILGAEVSIQEVDSEFGLILESRSGSMAAGAARNPDYLIALDLILLRLQRMGVQGIRISVVSKLSMRI